LRAEATIDSFATLRNDNNHNLIVWFEEVEAGARCVLGNFCVDVESEGQGGAGGVSGNAGRGAGAYGI